MENFFDSSDKTKKCSHLHKTLLLCLIAANIVFHLFSISYPPDPVFDESHFATYAASYASHTNHYDIHPPLGKLIYALPLVIFENSSRYFDARFIGPEEVQTSSGEIIPVNVSETYNNFPYVPLRLISALFGILLSIAVYFFIRVVTHSPYAALWGMFFVTFENTILLDTRLIHMDGILLAFGFASLALLFSKKVRPLFAGLVLGLALSVKLTAVLFIGPALLFSVLNMARDWKTSMRSTLSPLLHFVSAGLLVLILFIFFVYPFVMPLKDRLLSYTFVDDKQRSEFLYAFSDNTPYPLLKSEFVRQEIISGIYFFSQVLGYTRGESPNEYLIFESPWYKWPLMMKNAPYYQQQNIADNSERIISFIGNPVVWGLGLFALLFAIAELIRKRSKDDSHRSTLLLLLGSYIFSLLPFGFITRGVSLHHYFIAFIFEICLLAYTVAYIQKSYPNRARQLTYILVIFTLIGFSLIFPYTYGLSLPIR